MKTLLIASLVISTTAFIIVKTYFNQSSPSKSKSISKEIKIDNKEKQTLNHTTKKNLNTTIKRKKTPSKPKKQKKQKKKDGHDFKELLEDDIEFIEMT